MAVREWVVPNWVRRLNNNPCRVSTETTLMHMAYFMGLGRLQWNRNSGHWQPQSFSQVSGVDGGKWSKVTYFWMTCGKTHPDPRDRNYHQREDTGFTYPSQCPNG